MKAFEVRIPETALEDVQARLRATRWLSDDGYGDSAGASLRFASELATYWLACFDWRALERQINGQPNFVTDIDGLRIHTIHRRSSRPDAIPLLLIHGWPSSFLEFLGVCEALAEPEGDGPAFHVIAPSLPGYGFSTTRPGISPRRIAAIFLELMTRLGHDRFIVQGANWGSTIGTIMAREAPERLIGLHLNSVNATPPDEPTALDPADQLLADKYLTLLGAPHFNLLSKAPQSITHALNDSPAGLAAWVGDRLCDWADPDLPENPGVDPDWIIGTAALTWFTGTAGTSAMLYREAMLDPVAPGFVGTPTAVAAFANELVLAPRKWAERHYNIVRWKRYERGGHFAAVEVPEVFLADVRSFAAMLR
jgi:epoxide hydrolase